MATDYESGSPFFSIRQDKVGGSSPEGVSGGKSEGTGYTATKTQSEERKGQSFSLVKASISIGVGSVSAGVSEGTSVSETID